jgi:hypothetical protein
LYAVPGFRSSNLAQANEGLVSVDVAVAVDVWIGRRGTSKQWCQPRSQSRLS